MTKKRYDYNDGQFVDIGNYNSNRIMPTDSDDLAEELYTRLGERFKIKWPSDSMAEPIVDTDDLPKNLTLSDIADSLNQMKNDNIL